MKTSIGSFGQGRLALYLTLFTLTAVGRAEAQSLDAWGQNSVGQATVPGSWTNLTAVAGGAVHTLALLSDGSVLAWGGNLFGQTNVPPELSLPSSGVTAIAAGLYHNLALKADGTVVAWGQNIFGQASVPAGLVNLTAIAAGARHSLALGQDGTVVGWGNNSAGQTAVPADLNQVVAIAAGGLHSLALKDDGTVVAWGSYDEGPIQVPTDLTNAIAIAAGMNHSLALCGDGTVVAWGQNNFGQTEAPEGLSNVVAIAAGGDHSLALRNDGVIVAWGQNNFGQAHVPTGTRYAVGVAAGRNHSLALVIESAPYIFDPPDSQTVLEGTNVAFSVQAIGSVPLYYQWTKDGVALADDGRVTGAATPSLNLANVREADSGSYRCVVSNVSGQLISEAAILIVHAIVIAGPESQSVLGGSTVAFSVQAFGSVPFSYQWTKDGVNLADDGRISGATAPTLTITNAWAGDGGAYRCVVTNPSGALASDPAVLVVTDPVLTTSPESLSVLGGTNVGFSVQAIGSVPLHYQWSKDGINLADDGRINGAMTAHLSITNVSAWDGGSYRCVVSNASGPVPSEEAMLGVTDPVILTGPANLNVMGGTNALFTVQAIGSVPLHYQWTKDGTNMLDEGRITGATTPSLTITDTRVEDTGNYSCVVSNLSGPLASQSALLQVSPFTIVEQPQNQRVFLGTTVQLRVVSEGVGPFSYQWMKNGAPLPDGDTISGSTTATLTILNAQEPDLGEYRCVVTNPYGSLTSQSAILVLSPGFPILHVWQDSPNPRWPYTNWATAAHVIQDAVEAAVDGDTVLVTNGVYATGGGIDPGGWGESRVVIMKRIMLMSMNGPEVTVIQGAKTPSDIRGVYLGPGAVLSGFTVANGHAILGGGVFGYSEDHYPEMGIVTNCTLTGNSAEEWDGGGGGACAARLYNCTLTGNSAAYGDGGGASYCTLHNCALTDNSAENAGGGAYAGTLYNCTLTGNSAYSGGGAAGGTLHNCALTGNSAENVGGGAYAGTLYNCTLTGNSAWSGGGISSGTLHNCIVYFNTASTGPNYSGGSFRYSCTDPLPPGEGNIAEDPRLASLTHVSADSPCIGAGRAQYSSGVDIDGEPWLDPPCMGADQYAASGAVGELVVRVASDSDCIVTNIVVLLNAQIEGQASANHWDLGDGTEVSNTLSVTHAWSEPGTYEVRLTAYNETYPTGVSATVTVEVIGAPVHYVSQANASPEFPYRTWQTAATDIQDAIDAAALSGSLVVVTNGIYASGTVTLRSHLRLESINGPEKTVIDGGSTHRCATVGENAVLSGFTLANGYASDGGGVWCEESGVITNCVLTSNSATRRGGGVYGGTLQNCLFTGNAASSSGGAAYASHLYNCVVTDNAAGSGGGIYQGSLHNCTVTGNTASSSGGAAYASYLYNCVVTDNAAGSGGAIYQGFLYNCTVTGNSASSSGGGIYAATLYNCIVYFNTAPSQPNYAGETLFHYSCTTPLPSEGPGNIDANPQLASSSHLSAASPCLGAGLSLYSSGRDIDGHPWANPPSMGGDEYVAGSGTGELEIMIEVIFPTVGVGFNAPFVARHRGLLAATVWDFADGTVLSNQPYASHIWTRPGTYEVRLTGYNENHRDGVSATAVVEVIEPVYYVNAVNPAPMFPYRTWQTAATNIQDAIGAALTNGLIWVTNGNYASGGTPLSGINRVLLTNGVTVRSVNGPGVTRINGYTPGLAGGASIRCAFVGNHSVLSGFSLVGGSAFGEVSNFEITRSAKGGGVLCEPHGLVTNCVIRNSVAYAGGGASGGRISHCMLLSNIAHGDGGGAYDCTIDNSILTANTAWEVGGGVCGGTLYNCTITENLADHPAFDYVFNGGGGAYRSALFNCVVHFNIASVGPNHFESSFYYSSTTPLPGGPGNISGDPLFVDGRHLRSDSPCIDAGTNLSHLIIDDLSGRPRPLDGDGNGIALFDMGAYEYIPHNQSPRAHRSAFTLIEDTILSGHLQADDPDADDLTFSVVSEPSLGSIDIQPDGQFIYAPKPNVVGSDAFMFKVTDGYLESRPVTVTVTILPVNDSPRAYGQLITMAEDTQTPITLTATDADGDDLTFVITAPPAHATLSGNAPDLICTPAANYHGLDSFTFKVNDGILESAEVTVTLNVVSVNDPPAAVLQLFPLANLTDNPADLFVISPNNSNAVVLLDGSLSSDVENDPLGFSWLEEAGTVPFAFGPLAASAFALGEHTVTLLVDDGTDTGTASSTFEVITGGSAVEELILQVNQSILERNRKQPLIATLKAACASFERGIFSSGLNQLTAFQNKVHAQVAPLDPELAEHMIGLAQEILDAWKGSE